MHCQIAKYTFIHFLALKNPLYIVQIFSLSIEMRIHPRDLNLRRGLFLFVCLLGKIWMFGAVGWPELQMYCMGQDLARLWVWPLRFHSAGNMPRCPVSASPCALNVDHNPIFFTHKSFTKILQLCQFFSVKTSFLSTLHAITGLARPCLWEWCSGIRRGYWMYTVWQWGWRAGVVAFILCFSVYCHCSKTHYRVILWSSLKDVGIQYGRSRSSNGISQR